MTVQVSGFDHVALYVRDVQASAQWYAQYLGMEQGHANDKHIFMRLADGQVLALFQAHDESQIGSGLQHLAFSLSESDKDQAIETLRAQGISISPVGPSLGFYDPDGYAIHFV